MNQNSNKPTFKSNNRTFSERSVGEDRQKRDKNRPHFASLDVAIFIGLLAT